MKSFLQRFLPWHWTWLFVLLLAGACTPGLPQRPSQLKYPPLEFHLPQVDQQVLDNGLRLYCKTDRELPLVHITALIGAGAITTPPEKSGFDSLFGATWRTGGAGARSAAELDDYLDQLAANLSTNLGPYTAQLDLSLRADDLASGIALLADLLRRPGFDGKRLELARLQAQEQVRRQNDNPQAIARRLLMAALYPDHYLGYTPTFESLADVSREDLVAFHQRYFAPNTLWLAVSGDFDRDTLVALLEQYFGDWAPRQVPEQPLPPVDRPDAGTLRVVQKALPQTTILIGDLGLTKDDPDQYAVRVFNYILGGGGFNSRMMREIRSDRGLAYSAYSYFQVGRRLPGPFVAGTETKSESVVPVLLLTRQIMTDLRDNRVTEDEINLAKESQINSFVFGFEDTHAIVSRQMTQDFFGYPKDYLETFRDRIAAVTAADILRVAREYVDLSRQQIVLVGDVNAYRTGLDTTGLPVIEVDPQIDP